VASATVCRARTLPAPSIVARRADRKTVPTHTDEAGADVSGQSHTLPPSSDGVLLHEICRRCIDELGVEHAAVAVADGHGGWAPAHATDPTAERLEEYAFIVGEGPSVDALHHHAPAQVADLTTQAAAARWPAWSHAAQAAGVCSVAAFPVQAGAIVSGALTVYSHRAGRLDGARFALALRLADITFLGLLDLMSGLTAVDRAGGIDVLGADVHRAAGMVMAQSEISIDSALARLRAHAFSSGHPLASVASDVLARRLRFEPGPRSAE
jgi:GAF domain